MDVGMMMVFAAYGWENIADDQVWDEEIRLARIVPRPLRRLLRTAPGASQQRRHSQGKLKSFSHRAQTPLRPHILYPFSCRCPKPPRRHSAHSTVQHAPMKSHKS